MHWRPLRLALLVLLVASLLLPFFATAQPSGTPAARVDTPPDVAPPPRVYVGLYLHDISNLSLGEGTYDIDADLWVKWLGAFDPDEIRFANASDIERETLEVARDGDWHSARWRVRGTLRGDFPVQDFPLDRQAITVQLELPRSKGELVPDLAGSGISHRFSITDWNWSNEFRPVVSTVRYPSDLGSIVDEGRSAEVRRVSFEVALARPLMPVILKLFLPLAVVALIVFLSLFVPPDSLQPRLTMCVTGLVACFAFQFSIADVMPSVAYLILADVLFITVYILAIVCVAIAVAGHVFHVNGKRALAERIQRTARVLAPLAMATAVYWALPSVPEAAAVSVAELPAVERNPSTRDVVRIGTLSALLGPSSAMHAASNWGASYALPDGRQHALVVERMPRIDNEDMRFLADGTLQVTWTLREDARWSDGTPITAKDMTLPLELRPDTRIARMDTVDDRTVVLTWNERIVDALRAPTLWPSSHMLNTVDTDDEAAVRRYLMFGLRPTTGPYHVIEQDDARVVAVRNPHFLLPAASIARIEVYRFETSGALREALQRGDIDIAQPNALSNEDFALLRDASAMSAVETPSATFVFLGVALRDAPWDQPAARKALLQAIDRKRLAASEWGEASSVADVPSTAILPENFPRTAYNPEAARATFEALGLIGTEVLVQWAPPFSQSFVDRIAADLEAVGLVPRVEAVRSSARLWAGQRYEGLLLHALRVERSSPSTQWWALRSSGNRHADDERHAAWTDADFALLDKMEHALFRERRTQLQARVDRRWAEALPMIPLVFAGERVVVDPALRGWERTADGPFGITMDTWYFEE